MYTDHPMHLHFQFSLQMIRILMHLANLNNNMTGCLTPPESIAFYHLNFAGRAHLKYMLDNYPQTRQAYDGIRPALDYIVYFNHQTNNNIA